MGRPRLPDPPRFCAACGKEMFRKMFASALEDRTAFSKRKYCDQACMARGMTGKILVPTAQNSRNQSKKQRRTACEHCGATSRLHVHHRDSNPLNNAPSNLTTLCAPCHMKQHWREWKATKFPAKPCLHCARPARHRGLCNTHYTRFRRNGDPLLKRVQKKGARGVWITVRCE